MSKKKVTLASTYDYCTDHASWIFYLSWGALLLFLILYNVQMYCLSISANRFNSLMSGLQSFLFCAGVILFPVGTVFYCRKKPFAFSWMMVVLLTFVIALSNTFGFQNPYTDDPFYDRPLMRLLDNWSAYYFLFAVVQGGIMTVLRLIYRKHFNAEDKQCCRKTSIILTAFVILFSIASLICTFLFMP